MTIIRNTNGAGLERLKGFITDLTNEKVVVGVTSGTNGVRGNALIAMVHEFGSPSKGIPERSFLRSTVLEQADKYAKIIAETIPQAINGGMSEHDAYSRLGTVAMNDVKMKIASGEFAPLSQKTIDRKGSSKPLIDTGALRQSITFEVR